MIVWIDDEIFRGEFRDIDLLGLFRACAIRRHTLIISNEIGKWARGLDCPHFSSWIRGQSEKLASEIRLLREKTSMVASSILSHGGKVSILVTGKQLSSISKDVCVLSVSDAARALTLPLSLIVENQINDGAFLRTVIPPAWVGKINQWERNGELRFVQGGGNSEMVRLVEFHTNDEKCRQAFGLPENIWRLTNFIIYDHDGDKASSPSETSIRLDQLGSTLRGSHRLWRRTQENYIPIPVLYEIVEERATGNDDKNKLKAGIGVYSNLGEERHFAQLPKIGSKPFFKNEFSRAIPWNAEAAKQDGIWKETTKLAEKIAAAI